jgi:hypothetical protein
MKLTYDKWGGTAPRLDKRVLPAGFATESFNTRPDPYSLKPWLREQTTTGRVKPTAKQIYRYHNGQWFETDRVETRFVSAPIINDPNHEVVYCDHEGVKFTRNDVAIGQAPYPSNGRLIGVPQPAKPGIKNNNPPPASADIQAMDIAYVVTFVNEFGREGPASQASSIVTTDSKKVNITITRPALPTGAYALGNGSKWRLYRTNTASDGAGIYQYAGEAPITNSTMNDTLLADEVLEQLSTADWFAPADTNRTLWPSGPLKGLVNVANSFLAGFTGRTLCFSVPGVPHAWPPAYQIVVEYDIVGLAAVGSEVVVLTKGHPYVVSGSAPGNLTATKLPDPQACISAQSIVAFEDKVIYATPDGLCAVTGQRSELLTSEIFDERSWNAIKPTTILASYYEGAYIAKTDVTTFIYLPGAGTNSYRTINFRPVAMFNELESDTLFYHEGDGVIKAFNKGEGAYRYEWKSGIARNQKKNCFTWGCVYASDYPVEITLTSFFDGAHERSEKYIARSSAPFRLKGGYLANEFVLGITGDKTVHSVEFANSLEELSL